MKVAILWALFALDAPMSIVGFYPDTVACEQAKVIVQTKTRDRRMVCMQTSILVPAKAKNPRVAS